MSVDLSVDSIGDSFEPREDFISSLTRWYGRELSWNDFPQLFTDVERRITDLILRGDRQSELLIYKLAWIGSSPEKRPLIEKQIAHLIRTSDGWEIQQVGFGKSCSKGWKSACKAAEKTWDATCEVAEKAWDATCKAAEKTCDFVVDFWEENKKEIIIGIVVVTTAVVETAVTIYTGGTGTQIAVAGGAALVQSFVDDPSNKSIPGAPPITPPFPQPSPTGISLGYINPIQITPFATPSEVMIPAPQLPTPPALPQPIFQTFDPQLSLEGLYGRDYVSRIYEQFLLPDPYLQSTPPLNVPALPIETIPKGPSVGEFIALIETKLGETRNPNYSDQWKLKNEGPSNAQQFRELLAQKLAEPADPNYLANLMPKHEGPSNAQQIRELISDKLREVDDPNYWATMETIRNLFPTTDISVSRDNYASSLSGCKPTSPFEGIPLLGFLDQSTVHFHCGINNNVSTIVEGGLRLNNALDKGYAIQPHLVHSNSLVKGLTFVGLERLDRTASMILPAGVTDTQLTPFPLEVPAIFLEKSQIQSSINYEVETLSKIAQNILETGNPNLKQVHVTFSNGGYVFNEALKQLPQKYRDTIIVITTGTTAIIEKDLACVVYNVIGDKDWPSQSCNGGLSGIEDAKNRARLEIIFQTETQTFIGGHYFVQPDYQDKVSKIIKEEINNKYDIY